MNCWNCGKELTDGAAFCTGCGASAVRREPETPEGRALRSLLDHYGVERALEGSFRLPGGLGDLLDRPEPLRTHLKLALDAGLGQLLLTQLRENGAAPTADFAAQERTLLTDRAGLSGPAAESLMRAVDEMLGWQSAAAACAQPVERPMERPSEFERMAAAAAPAVPAVASAGVPAWLKVLGVLGAVLLVMGSLGFETTTWCMALLRLVPVSMRKTSVYMNTVEKMLGNTLSITPVLLSLMALYQLGKGRKKAAGSCAVANAAVIALMLIGLGRMNAWLAMLELPMALYAALLVLVTTRDSVEPWAEAGMWATALLGVGCFAAMSFLKLGSVIKGAWEPLKWSKLAWLSANWFEMVFLNGATYYQKMSGCLTAFFPLHRVLQMAMTAVWLRVLRKRLG